jgi:acetoin utilization deacetylase AcuC-like enzyme
VLPFKLLFHPGFTVDLGPHVFPAQKYRLVRERLLQDGLAAPEDFVTPEPATDQDLLRVHTRAYLAKATSGRFTAPELRVLEVPWSPELAAGCRLAAGAAIEAGRLARRDGCAFVLGGGFHHAFPDHGEGFCLINDVAVAVVSLRAAGELARVAIVDLDVHHGNGTAAILGDDPLSFTLSIHQEDNYPGFKPPGRLDIGLPDGTGDEEYLAALDAALSAALGFSPELVYYLAGADPYEQDLLGGLRLTQAGLRERDRRVFASARRAGVPVAVTLAGGYAQRPADTVAIHVNTLRAAVEVYA